MSGFYINYTVVTSKTPEHLQAGPYTDFSEAEYQCANIKGYVGITNVYIVNCRNPTRRLVGKTGSQLSGPRMVTRVYPENA